MAEIAKGKKAGRKFLPAKLFKAKYLRYLRSAKWRDTRRRIMIRDKGRCRCGQRAVEVHHLTYARVFEELDTDLVAICIPCHEKIHQ